MRKEIFVLLFSIIAIIPVVSAGVSIDALFPVYNIGDNFDLIINVNANKDTSDFLSAEIVCSEGSEMVYKSPVNLASGEEKKIDIRFELEPSILGSLIGNCYIRAIYGEQTYNSGSFELTKEVNINVNVSDSFDPGEDIVISGMVNKKNGNPLEGSADFSIEELGIYLTKEIKAGVISGSLTIPKNARTGQYNLKIRTYDNGGSAIYNDGSISRMIKVNQVLTSIDIALNEVKIIPGNELSYTPLLLDQSGEKMSGEMSIRINQPLVKKSREMGNFESGIPQKLMFDKNATKGIWNITGVFNDFSIEKNIEVGELSEILSYMENGFLIIKNIGNVPYTERIAVSISGIKKEIEVSLGIGKSKKYKVNAPDGSYMLSVITGKSSYEIGNTFLTGNAVNVEESGINMGKSAFFAIWGLIFAILAVAAVVLYKKIRKKDYFASSPGEYYKDLGNQARNSEISSGNKQEVSLVLLNIKNWESLNDQSSNAILSINRLSKIAKEKNAKVHTNEGEYTFIFAPSITKDKENTMRSLKFAEDAKQILEEYNGSFAQKIEFGIAVNEGKMIISDSGEKMRFASLGNVVTKAKGLARKAKENILISEEIRNKVAGKIKVEKKNGDLELKGMPNREKHAEFLKKSARDSIDGD